MTVEPLGSYRLPNVRPVDLDSGEWSDLVSLLGSVSIKT
jgi:hypothetical protein